MRRNENSRAVRRFKPSQRYNAAYAALCGVQTDLLDLEEVKPKSVSPKPNPSCLTEAEEQIIAATWLSKRNIPFYHVPNGGYRDYYEGAKLKRMGVKSGVPDLCICVARGGYHGLYIELKRVYGGKLSDTQLVWRDILIKEGYMWREAKGSGECIRIVEDYLKL